MAQMGASSGGTGRVPVAASANSNSSVTVLTVTGRVVNAVTGQPVPRALVRLNGDRAVLADHEGKFEIPQFAAGNAWYNLTLTKPGFYETTEPFGGTGRRVRIEDLSSALELKMYPEALITGTVAGPDGQPLPHINVMAQRSVYGMGVPQHTWMMVGQGSSNERGNFRIAVPPGNYRIQTTFSRNSAGQAVLAVALPANNATSKSDTFHLASGSEQHFDLRPVVGRTYSVSLAVDSTGEGRIPTIIARSGDGTVIPIGGMRPSGPGEMKVELPSGTYTLEATLHLPGSGPDRSDSVFYGETRVTVTDHDVTDVTLHMAAVPSIPVVVDVDPAATSDKAPPTVPQIGLMLEAADSSDSSSMSEMNFGQNVFAASTSPDGSVSFRPNPGTYRLEIRSGGAWYVKAASYGTADLLTQNLTVAAGAGSGLIRLTVSDQTGAVRGSVSLHGKPAECELDFVPEDASGRSLFIARSGSDGKYNLVNLLPGTYRVVAFEQQHSMNFRDPHALDAFATHVRTVTVAAGDKATLDLDAVAESEVVP
ncbi:MAG TPA: carboxypeptidase-like regulatory domain-containing protein [Edaphobacter sp.]